MTYILINIFGLVFHLYTEDGCCDGGYMVDYTHSYKLWQAK